MLDLLSGVARNCERMDRRSFLKIGSLGGLGITLPCSSRQQARAERRQSRKADVNCIFVWTLGGTSHHDTLDPKPEAPASVKGPFGVIDTAVPGVKFTEVCPRLAQELNRFSVLRSWNPKNGSHGFADQYCMSGRLPNPALTYPCLGSVDQPAAGIQVGLAAVRATGELRRPDVQRRHVGLSRTGTQPVRDSRRSERRQIQRPRHHAAARHGTVARRPAQEHADGDRQPAEEAPICSPRRTTRSTNITRRRST